jgi:hypothetical protein
MGFENGKTVHLRIKLLLNHCEVLVVWKYLSINN